MREPIRLARPDVGEDELDAVRNRVWLGPLVDGAYDEGLLRVAPELADPALVRDGDLALVRGSADWIGVNYYTPFVLGTGVILKEIVIIQERLEAAVNHQWR